MATRAAAARAPKAKAKPLEHNILLTATLCLLAAGAVSVVTVPVAHAMSRAFERSADRFALDLTRNPGAFISAMRRLGAQNLAEEGPPRLAFWFLHTHPTIDERIASARAFESG